MQEIEGNVHKIWPLSGKIEVQNALDHLQDLLAGRALRGRKDRQDTISKPLLLIFGNERLVWVVVAFRPAAVRAVLEVDDG